MPGSFCSWSTKRVRGSGRAKIRRGLGNWELGFGSSSQTGDFETAHEAGHRLSELLVDLAVGVVDGGDDQILQHLHVVFRHNLRVDRDRQQLFGAVDDDRDHAAAGGRFDAQLSHLLLQLLLHLLGLLHHGLDIHRYISSTSRISAGHTSSTACTVDDDSASAFSSRLPVAAGASDVFAASAGAWSYDVAG